LAAHALVGQDGILRAAGNRRKLGRLTIGPQDTILPHNPVALRRSWRDN